MVFSSLVNTILTGQSGFFGQKGTDIVSRADLAPSAKSTANGNFPYLYLVKGNLEGIGKGFGFHVGAAIGTPDLQAVVMIKSCHNCIGFGLEIGFFRGHKGVFSDIIGFFEVLIHMARINIDMDIDIIWKFLMDELGLRCHGCHGIKHGRQFLVSHINEIKGFECGLFINCSHACHFITDVSCLFRLNKLLIAGIGKYSPFYAFSIFSSDYCLDAGKCQGF